MQKKIYVNPKSNPVQGVLIGVMLSIVLWCAGCRMINEGLIALHDSIDEVTHGKVAPTNDNSTVADKVVR